MSNNVFYIEWQGKYTNKSYRLEVFGAGNIMSKPTYIKIDKVAIDPSSIEWSFKDIPMGISSDCSMKIKWELDYVHNDELETLLFNPRASKELPTDIDSVPFDAGNVYELKCDGVTVYRGIQLTDESFAFDGSNTYEVELIGLGKYLLTCFDLKQYIALESHLLRLHSKQSPSIIEYFSENYPANGNVKCIMSQTSALPNNVFQKRLYFWELSSFENWIKSALTACATILLRRSVTVDFEIPLAQYFKQNYANNSYVGDQLIKSDIYILTYIQLKNALAGLFSYVAKDSMGNQYATLYDLLADWSLSEGQKYFVSPDGLTIKPLSIFAKNPTEVQFDEEMTTLKQVKKFNLKQVTVSLQETGGDDVASYRYNAGSPRNNEELQIPLIWNNTPPASNYKDKWQFTTNWYNDYREVAGMSIYTEKKGKDIYTSLDPMRLWNFYYFDQAPKMIAQRAFRVHDFCRVDTKIRNDFAEQKMTTDPSVANIDRDLVDSPKQYCLAVQMEHAKASMFKKLNDYFGADKVCRLEISVPLLGYNFNTLFAGANNVYQFDLTKFTDKAVGYPAEYHLTKAVFNVENETFDLTLVGVQV